MARFTLKGASIVYGASTDPLADPFVAPNPSTALGQVVSGDCDFGEMNLVDVTVVTDTRKEVLPGTHETLKINATVQWDPALTGHGAAMTAYLAQNLVSVGIVFPDTGAAKVVANGYWTNVTAPVSVDGAMQATFAFVGTGPIAFTA